MCFSLFIVESGGISSPLALSDQRTNVIDTIESKYISLPVKLSWCSKVTVPVLVDLDSNGNFLHEIVADMLNISPHSSNKPI